MIIILNLLLLFKYDEPCTGSTIFHGFSSSNVAAKGTLTALLVPLSPTKSRDAVVCPLLLQSSIFQIKTILLLQWLGPLMCKQTSKQQFCYQ